jgi:hypothetical protein
MRNFLLTLLMVGGNLVALACDCVMTPVEQHIKATPYLLICTAVEILDGSTKEGRQYRSFMGLINADTISRGKAARIRVQEDIKGAFKAGVTIEVDSHYSNCEPTFEIGKKYVLFLHKENHALFVTMCSYSVELDNGKYAQNLLKSVYKTRLKRP